jgi:hypothetical protein
MVTSDGGSVNNIIYWDKTAYSNVDSFIVYREVSTSVYARIAAISNDSLSEYTDTSRHVGPANGDPNVGSYRYKLQIRDSCGNYGPLSPYHNTIYIIDAGSGQFTWSIPYTIEGASNPVSNYILLCDTANVNVWGPVGIVAGTQSSATDPGFANHSNIANWRVKTAWSINCTPTRTTVNTTRSNIKHAALSTGILNAALGTAVVVYPNPATEEVTIGLSPDIRSAVIRIENLLGQLILTENVTADGNSGTSKKINISSYPKGVYLVSIESAGSKTFKKLVVH